MASEEWLVIDSGRGGSGYNIALDEALLESMPRLNRPVLRFYGWNEPAATFGYFQRFEEVKKLTGLRPLVRRPTGGGIVPHNDDWTYSLVIPTTHEWYAVKAVESYRRIHQWVQMAFGLIQVESQLAQAPSKAAVGQCFVGFEQFDLLHEEKKIAGAAQRRRKDGLLIQGSVQPPTVSSRADWQRAMCLAGERRYGITWKSVEPDEQTKERARALASTKYDQVAFNQGR